ncbi:hypothetical protein POL68_24970 [Stigmatella sp. ncwal1]|uniref:HEAT repeat domain-containing protein n=1 Tax=Stigmatella ashevillensis TaxID=2995309 RepID=A0ABT5DDH6_9BACT|nr:hypothetical protein [Stigmatella ashevillena]MDC0711745.1 hypothetical protein [Stigmatella ashevillena]
MASKIDGAKAREELVRAFKEGDEERARIWVSQLGAGPRRVRGVLEALLEDPLGLARQAAAFGLGELGGAASVRRLEQQLAMEEARGDADGAAVVEDILRALGRIEERGARLSLMRKLERLARGTPERSEVYALARALWRRRHPELLPGVRQSLGLLSLPAPHGLHGLCVLLEKSPEELGSWARDPTVPVEEKTRVLAVLEEEVPEAWLPTLSSFLFAAQDWSEPSLRQNREAAYYVECLFSLLLMDRDRFVATLPEQGLTVLRAVARRLVAATFPNPSLRAATLLGMTGEPEDAAFLRTHCPADSVCAQVFLNAAQALRDKR